MRDDFMRSSIHDIEFILDRGLPTLMYDGNFDIICDHTGILDMLNDLQWTGASDYQSVLVKIMIGHLGLMVLELVFKKLFSGQFYYKNNLVLGQAY